jgi:2-keto-3-deoxy-L-arabinonate dehydratase
MTLPPTTMKNDEQALVDHYVDLAATSTVPIMVQVSPQISAYNANTLSVEALAQIADRAPNVRYFKIEGSGSPQRIEALKALIGDKAALFGGVGGIAMRDELQAGASGLLPGCGFNEYFVRVWAAFEAGQDTGPILQEAQPLVDAVSGRGHEFSLHARKFLLQRAGIISNAYVRRPTVPIDQAALDSLAHLSCK